MSFRILVLIALASLFIIPGLAEEKEVEKPSVVHGFGFAAGPYAGIGLSYKAIILEKLGVQTTVGYYSDADKERWFRPGIEFQYFLSRHKWLCFYLTAGVGHEYDRYADYYFTLVDSTNWTYDVEIKYRTVKNTTAGFGFGWEAIVLQRLSGTAEAVYFFRDDGSSSILIQGGLHYYVNIK